MRRHNSIPVDILRNILGHLGKADLATMCLLNKVCCSCAQDVLYRDIEYIDLEACRTFSKSPHLAKRVRSFSFSTDRNTAHRAISASDVNAYLATSLRDLTSLRNLSLFKCEDSDILDGCTFKLETLSSDFALDESFRKFLNSQPSLTGVDLLRPYDDFSNLEVTCLPNLTQVTAWFASLTYLIPGRPVSEVISLGRAEDGRPNDLDLGFFTLSTSPILKLAIDYSCLYPKSAHLLASIFPSLTHLLMVTRTHTVRWPPLLFI
jgi:hypothetical protein